jgi:hypothetical protein
MNIIKIFYITIGTVITLCLAGMGSIILFLNYVNGEYPDDNK